MIGMHALIAVALMAAGVALGEVAAVCPGSVAT